MFTSKRCCSKISIGACKFVFASRQYLSIPFVDGQYSSTSYTVRNVVIVSVSFISNFSQVSSVDAADLTEFGRKLFQATETLRQMGKKAMYLHVPISMAPVILTARYFKFN